jgi:hypothetical protein
MTGKCSCGTVAITLARKPQFVNDCDCSFCSRLGAWWGYFTPDDVQVLGRTASFQREDRKQPAVDAHFCLKCGSTTHWTLRPHLGNETMGVNMRLFDISDLQGVEHRFPDGANWDGASTYGYRKAATMIGRMSH